MNVKKTKRVTGTQKQGQRVTKTLRRKEIALNVTECE
jgi:hypothetical protein